MTRTKKVLRIMSNGRPWAVWQIAKKLRCTEQEARMALALLRNSTAICVGPRTGSYSKYFITEVGRERMKLEAKKRGMLNECPEFTPAEVVQMAIRHQPNSVFALGAMG
jgi:hypothetical protein